MSNTSIKLPEESILFKHKQITCYAIRYAEQHTELMNHIYEGRKVSYTNHGFNGEAMVDYNKGAEYSYQVILWDNAHNQVIAGYVVNLVNETVENLGWDCLWLSRTFSNLSEIICGDAKTIMLEHSFVAPGYQKRSLALLLVWRGVVQLISQLCEKCYLIGLTGIPFRKFPAEVYSLYISCLRYSAYFTSKKHQIRSLYPFDETQHLSGEQIKKSKQVMSFNEMESFISSATGFPFKLPILFKNYTKHFSAEILDFAISDRSGSLSTLQRAEYEHRTPPKLLKKAPSQLVRSAVK